jgi:hypothetical protein
MSKTVKKKRALKLIERRANFRKLVKEGKAEERSPRRFNKERETQQQAPRTTPGSGLGENTPIAR